MTSRATADRSVRGSAVIQSAGALIGASPDLVVMAASENLVELIGTPADAVIDRTLDELLGGRTVHDLRNRLQLLDDPTARGHLSSRSFGDNRLDIGVGCASSGTVWIELEPVEASPLSLESLATRMMSRLRGLESVDALCSAASRMLRLGLGYERVSIQSSGACAPSRQCWWSEPPGARAASELDLAAFESLGRGESGLNMVVDAEADGVALIASADSDERAIDVSPCALAAPSPSVNSAMQNLHSRALLAAAIPTRQGHWGCLMALDSQRRHAGPQSRATLLFVARLLGLLIDSRPQQPKS